LQPFDRVLLREFDIPVDECVLTDSSGSTPNDGNAHAAFQLTSNGLTF
jgi:hypothetical protein